MCEKDFNINEKGWYTYEGRIVLATANRKLLNYGFPEVNGIKYYNYYDKISITINNETYDGIILDSCGACMYNPIIDLFVSNGKYEVYTTNVYIN